MESLLLIIPLAGFLATLVALPNWIKKARGINLVWRDMNKYKKVEVAGSGGIGMIFGFILSVLLYIALKTFYFKSQENIVEIFSLTSSILILAGVGVIDDLLGWHKGGLSKKFRLFLCLFAAVPLMVINAGHSVMNVPFIGNVDLGLFYPLLLIPIGIIGAATTFNFLAGYNGLEAGQGIIMLTALSIVAYFSGSSWLALMGLCMVFSLLAFLVFNKFPARVFPGDVLTYSVGGLIAIMAILGNFEKIAVFFFIPYIIEVFLKARGKLKMQSFGKPNKDGSLEPAYNKIYGLEHLAIVILKKCKGKASEKEAVYLIWIFQVLIILIGFLIFRGTIF